ncbi:hypothetical protein BCR42DRAFT_67875 [Absidia repens]|uniref:Protein kinase domain-containing protein n=1 Tax=Absidia repens TaxID=90262 RepID=A0A1X2IDI3_9FUNG|nr:hypothetical protein BCR42DRAFT_67875 [Absidia repens]
MEEVKRVRWSSSETDAIASSHSPTAFSTLGAGGSTPTLPSTALPPYTSFDFSFRTHYTTPESSNDDESESDMDLFPDDDDEDDDEDEDSEVDDDDSGQPIYYGPSSATTSQQASHTITAEIAHERREWQQMLQSVLRGEVIKSEKKRLLNTDVLQQKNSIQEIWLSLRALLRGRTMTDEIKFLEESRQSIDQVVETIMQFKVNPDADDPALIQVAEVLKNVDRVESLYATRAEMIQAHPRYGSLSFQVRLDALNAWCTVTRSLRMQFKILRNWTGSDDLQISHHRLASSSSSSPVAASSYTQQQQHHHHNHHHNHQHHHHHHHHYHRTSSDSHSSTQSSSTINPSEQQLPLHTTTTSSNTSSDTSYGGNLQNKDFSFVERILRESALQDTFDKRTLSALNSLLLKSKETMIANSTLFHEMNLPPFVDELQHLARFPARLVEEALNIRLETKDQIIDPPKQMVDAMLEDCRGLLALAYRVKQQYQELAHPAPGWTLADDDDLTKKYDAVVMDAVRFYFKLMTWKLDFEKENSLRECEVLEKEWEFLQSTVCQNTVATYYECTEQFCGLTIRQLQDVMTDLNAIIKIDKQDGGGDVDLESRYTKLLHVMRMRARKILQFAKFFMGKLENAAEYSFDPNNLDVLVQYLVETGHFFVRTNTYEDERIYIIASPSLYNRPEMISVLVQSGFSAPKDGDSSTTPNIQSGYSSHYFTTNTTGGIHDNLAYDVQQQQQQQEQQQDYVLFVAPWQSFFWTGVIMDLDNIPLVNIHLKPKRVRLVTNISSRNFKAIKSLFWTSIKHAGLGIVREQRSHVPKIHKDMRKLKATIYKLTETIMTSVYTIRDQTLTSGCHELVEECFSFASDFGIRVSKLFDPRHRLPLDLKLTQLAIQWICFITDDCTPTDRRTFRWAVAALEFGQVMTKGTNMLALGDADFSMLQSKVARCIALLISHFDVLGTRWTFEVQQKEELRKRGITARRNSYITSNSNSNISRTDGHDSNRHGGRPHRGGHSETSKGVAGAELGNEAAVAAAHRYIRDAWMRDITQLESARSKKEQEANIVGKVLDDQKPEDQSLVFLAPSSSNISFRWQQGRYIGAGTFGSVYMAINLDTSSIMAVKEIRFPDSSALSALHKAIKEEMNVMEMLSHRNIVQYYGMEVHRDKVNIFMEYCENGSLGSLLEGGGRIEAEYYIVDYVYQLLSGLAYLHDNNILHRDIKPDNILIDHQGQLKLTDFGASKIIAHGQKTLGVATAKVANSLAGTPMYMSPEVITGGDTGRKGSMDIWSLGCCVVQMATGRRPWSTLDNEWSVMFHVVTGHPPLPDPSQLSSSGISFLKQCFTRNPHERPTAHELLSHSWITNYLEHGIIVDEDDNDDEKVEEVRDISLPPSPNILNDATMNNSDDDNDGLKGETISVDHTAMTTAPILPSLPTPSTSATQLFHHRQQIGLKKDGMMTDQKVNTVDNNMLHLGDKDLLEQQQWQEKQNIHQNRTSIAKHTS